MLAEGSEPSLATGAEPQARSSATPAYLTIGAGAVALAAGGVLFALAKSKQSEADRAYAQACQTDSSRCGRNVTGDHDAYNLRVAGGIAAGVGAVAIGTGIYLFVAHDDLDAPETTERTLQPWFGLGQIGLAGSF